MVDWKARCPAWIKAPYRLACALVPVQWRHGQEYRRTRRLLSQSQAWNEDRLLEWQRRELVRTVQTAFLHVPFYRRMLEREGIAPTDVRAPDDLRRIPFTTRDDLAVHGGDFVSESVPVRRRLRQFTGGTSGAPAAIMVDRRRTLQRDMAFWDAFLDRFGLSHDDPMVVLRNDLLHGGRLSDYSVKTRRLRLNAAVLSPANVAEYLKEIRRSGIRILHTYPSAAVTLLRYAREAGAMHDLPIRWIVATSENLYPGQREFLEEGFRARLVTMYGHTERCVFAGECEHGTDYHINTEYGVLELIDEQENPIVEPGRQGEIVGTGFLNEAMPLLRYRTGDFAEYAPPGACACGRAYPRLRDLRGRRMQESIRKPDGGDVSLRSMNLLSPVFEHCLQIQLVQEREEELVVCVVPGAAFEQADEAAIVRHLEPRLGGRMRVFVRRVAEIPPTGAGKHRFLVQRLGKDLPD